MHKPDWNKLVELHTLSLTSLTMSRYGRPGFTISMSAPSLTSRSCRSKRSKAWSPTSAFSLTPAAQMYTHKPTHHSSNGEPPRSRGQLIAASVPKRRLWLRGIPEYKHSREVELIFTSKRCFSLLSTSQIPERMLTWRGRNNKTQTLRCSSARKPGGEHGKSEAACYF